MAGGEGVRGAGRAQSEEVVYRLFYVVFRVLCSYCVSYFIFYELIYVTGEVVPVCILFILVVMCLENVRAQGTKVYTGKANFVCWTNYTWLKLHKNVC